MRYTISAVNDSQIYRLLEPRIADFSLWLDDLALLPMLTRRQLAHNMAHTWLHGRQDCGTPGTLRELEADWGAYVLLWPQAAAKHRLAVPISAAVG